MSTTVMMSPVSNPSSSAIKLLAAGLLLVGAGLVAIPVFLIAGPTIEAKYLSPWEDWTATSVTREGDDLVIVGTMVRTRTCDYDPPPLAFNDRGLPVQIVSRGGSKGRNWPPSSIPRVFGPWVIPGGAGQQWTISLEARCHPAWPIVVDVGHIDDRSKP